MNISSIFGTMEAKARVARAIDQLRLSFGERLSVGTAVRAPTVLSELETALR